MGASEAQELVNALRHELGIQTDFTQLLLAFALLCAAFFGVYELLSLTIIEGLGSTVLVSSVALTGGLLAWSLVGLKPQPKARPDRAVLGPGLVLFACLLVIAALIVGGGAGVTTTIAGAVLGGVGMGAAYPLLSSEPFSTGRPAATVGTLIAFAETAATAWVAMLAGGLYSALHGQGWTPVGALQLVFVVLAGVALAATVLAAARRSRRARDDPA